MEDSSLNSTTTWDTGQDDADGRRIKEKSENSINKLLYLNLKIHCIYKTSQHL